MNTSSVAHFIMPGTTVIGVGAHKTIPDQLRQLNVSAPLLVTDKGMIQMGIAQRIVDIVHAAGFTCTVFDDVVPNPTDVNVEAGLAVYQRQGCDSLITLGGGSAHDCGKGIGLLVGNGGRIHDYEGVDRSARPMPPAVAVNTTAGTASEMTRFCIITDTARKVKMSIVDRHVTPAVALDDPELMVGMPPSLTAATGMDALTHAVEAFVSTQATHMTDACAEKAIRLVGTYLRRAVGNGHNLEAREAMCHAQYLAGMAFNNAGLGGVHAMAHQLGGVFNLPHGECNALLLPHVCRFNLSAAMERFAAMAEWLGVRGAACTQRDAAVACVNGMADMVRDVGIPERISLLCKRRSVSADAERIPRMAENALRDACIVTNPRAMSIADVVTLFRAAW